MSKDLVVPWKSKPLWGFVTVLLVKVIERGIVAMVRVTKDNNKTKVDTVFDWDKPEHADLFAEAKEIKKKGNPVDQGASEG